MSRLDELIAELCPDGVEYTQILSVLTQPITDGPHETPSLQEQGIPFVSVEAIHDGIVDKSKCRGFISREYSSLCRKKYKPESGDVYMVKSASIGRVAIVGEDTGFDIWSPIAAMRPNKEIVEPKFLFYVLQTERVQKEVTKKASKSSQPNLSMRVLERFRIPVPPLEVQREIVRVLDNFTFLSAELSAELQARKKQYECYREKLMRFDNVPYVSIDILFPYIRNGFVGTVTKHFSDKETGVRYLEGTNIHNGVISDNEELYVTKEFHNKHIKNELKADDILMVQSGHIGDCAVVGEKYEGANCHALIIMSNGGQCISKFYVHYFHTIEGVRHLKPAITDGNLKHVLAGKMSYVKVPFPPIEMQKHITMVLDHFEALCTDISSGLPAEIRARQKQYEYYRDKLLSFKEKDA